MSTSNETPGVTNSLYNLKLKPAEKLAAAIDCLPQTVSGHHILRNALGLLSIGVSYPLVQEGTPNATNTPIEGVGGAAYWLNRSPGAEPLLIRSKFRIRDLIIQGFGGKIAKAEFVLASPLRTKILATLAVAAVKKPNKRVRPKNKSIFS